LHGYVTESHCNCRPCLLHRKLKNLSQLAAAYDPQLAHHLKVTITDEKISEEQPAEPAKGDAAVGADQQKPEQKGPNAAEMVSGMGRSCA
jgi:hypothetical protein